MTLERQNLILPLFSFVTDLSRRIRYFYYIKMGEFAMFLYTVLEAVVGVLTGMFLAVRTKKADGVVYGKLDKTGRITNILLITVFICLAPVYLFLGMISQPAYGGFLGLVGWIISLVNASAALLCGLGLGFSVALRKKGKSKLSFAVQFAGLVAIGLTVGMYCLFAGNLLRSLNR